MLSVLNFSSLFNAQITSRTSQSLTPFFKKFSILYIQNNFSYLQIIEHGIYLFRF